MSLGISTVRATHTREVDPLTVTQRLQREGRWTGQIELERNDMMKLAKGRSSTKAERQQWVYGELDRMYPPLEKTPLATSEDSAEEPEKAPMATSGDIVGLSEIPEDWPELPANASLSAEVGWVQANRLRIVEERERTTRVHLGRALSPAPSWAALGWLETSIRNYAKFVDVAAKVRGSDEGESAVMRRERVAIEEVERLLAEMRAEED